MRPSRAVFRSLSLAATLLAFAPAAASALPKRVAVLTPSASWSTRCGDAGRDAATAGRCDALETIADAMRAGALVPLRGRDFIVMTRENMAELTRGNEAPCSDASCEVEAARLVGADYVLSGGVTFLEETYFLTVKLHDVMTAKLLETTTVKGGRLVELVEAAKDSATGLVRSGLRLSTGPRVAGGAEGRIEGPDQPAWTDEPEEVVVTFESEPTGASVRLDGELLCKDTPCRKRIALGGHHALFEKERYGSTTLPFSAARGTAVKATLAPRFGWVTVETTPPGLGIAFDGVDVGPSPIAAREVDVGKAEVLVRDRCYVPTGETLVVKAGERRTVRIAAKPRLARLNVNAEDAKGNALETDVRVDGAVLGSAGRALPVPVCARRLEVELAGERFATELRLEEGKLTRIDARPQAELRQAQAAEEARKEAARRAEARRAEEQAEARARARREEEAKPKVSASEALAKWFGKADRKRSSQYLGASYRYGPMEAAMATYGFRSDWFGMRVDLGAVAGKTYAHSLGLAGEDFRFTLGYGVELDPVWLPVYLGFEWMLLGSVDDADYNEVLEQVWGQAAYAGRRFGPIQVEVGAMRAQDRPDPVPYVSAGLVIDF